MNFWDIPWLELAIAVPLVGSLWVSRIRDPFRAFAWGLAFSGATLACVLLAWLEFHVEPAEAVEAWSLQPALFGRELISLDALGAPLVVLVALLHFLTALATGRTKMRRFSLTWSLATEAISLATFSTREPSLLIALLIWGTIPGYIELASRGKPLRVYLVHMASFALLLVLGWALAAPAASEESGWTTIPLVLAILIRCGTVPVHCWLTDWFEHASFGNALLNVAPLTGFYAAVRLLLPVAPDWVLQWIGLLSLFTAVYAAGMAVIQQEARRFFAFLFLSHASLVLVGLELHTSISLTGALALWISVPLSLGGFGLTLRALEARFGRLSLNNFHGLYEHSPALAICFLLTGLASVGFPGTLGFVATELLVDGTVQVNALVGLVVILATALNGIAVLRVYFLLFTGTRHLATVSLNIGPRERFAVLTLTALIIGGGLFPQPGIVSRYRAAVEMLSQRSGTQEVAADQGAAAIVAHDPPLPPSPSPGRAGM